MSWSPEQRDHMVKTAVLIGILIASAMGFLAALVSCAVGVQP